MKKNMNIPSVKYAYDLIAKEFSDSRPFTWKWVDDYILSLDNNLIIVDIGCGNGRLSNYNKLFGMSHFFVGLDISMMQLKNNIFSADKMQSCMLKLPFLDNSVDNIICIASFHHLKNIDERRHALSEMKRILNKNTNKNTNKNNVLLSVWSINQPSKTKRTFDKYGDTIVEWKMKNGDIIKRYYYIFELNEIIELLQEYFIIKNHKWDCGNEIFELIV